MLDKFPIPNFNWVAIAPFAIVAITGMVALLMDMYRANKSNERIGLVTGLGFAVAIAYLLTISGKNYMAFESMIYIDSLAIIGQLVVLTSALLVVLLSGNYLKEKNISFGEFYPLIAWASLGAMLMCCSRNLLVIFIGIELLSISLYVLAGVNRGAGKSEEASLKYFLLGAFATGFLLYGMAFLYGATGTLELSSFGSAWARSDSQAKLLLSIGLGMLLVGLGFKSSMVPFHQWTPDVYQGAPTNVTAFMATGGKAGAFIVLLQVANVCAVTDGKVKLVFAVLAAITMTVGNILAFVQKDVKRMLAYSSIANAGYILVSIAAGAAKMGPSYDALFFYLIGYTFTTIGMFAVVSMLAKGGSEDTDISSLRGLYQQTPFAAAALVVFVLSLIGIGPVSGFLGKVLIISDALKTDLAWLAVLLVVNSIFGAFYYFNLLKAAFTPQESSDAVFKLSLPVKSTLAICVIGVIGSVVFFSPMMSYFVAQ